MFADRSRATFLFRVVSIAATGLLLSACGSGQFLGARATPSPTATPTSTPTAVPTATSSPTPTPAPTATPAAQESAAGIPGGSIADSDQQEQVFLLLKIFYAPAGCGAITILDTSVEKPPSKGIWTERWVIDFCGSHKTYLMRFMPAPDGGSAIEFSPQ
jgi:hypothetical protein